MDYSYKSGEKHPNTEKIKTLREYNRKKEKEKLINKILYYIYLIGIDNTYLIGIDNKYNYNDENENIYNDIAEFYYNSMYDKDKFNINNFIILYTDYYYITYLSKFIYINCNLITTKITGDYSEQILNFNNLKYYNDGKKKFIYLYSDFIKILMYSFNIFNIKLNNFIKFDNIINKENQEIINRISIIESYKNSIEQIYEKKMKQISKDFNNIELKKGEILKTYLNENRNIFFKNLYLKINSLDRLKYLIKCLEEKKYDINFKKKIYVIYTEIENKLKYEFPKNVDEIKKIEVRGQVSYEKLLKLSNKNKDDVEDNDEKTKDNILQEYIDKNQSSILEIEKIIKENNDQDINIEKMDEYTKLKEKLNKIEDLNKMKIKGGKIDKIIENMVNEYNNKKVKKYKIVKKLN